jgi:hypothetical protein
VQDFIKALDIGDLKIFERKGRVLTIDDEKNYDILVLVGAKDNLYIFDSIDSIYNENGNLMKRHGYDTKTAGLKLPTSITPKGDT